MDDKGDLIYLVSAYDEKQVEFVIVQGIQRRINIRAVETQTNNLFVLTPGHLHEIRRMSPQPAPILHGHDYWVNQIRIADLFVYRFDADNILEKFNNRYEEDSKFDHAEKVLPWYSDTAHPNYSTEIDVLMQFCNDELADPKKGLPKVGIEESLKRWLAKNKWQNNGRDVLKRMSGVANPDANKNGADVSLKKI